MGEVAFDEMKSRAGSVRKRTITAKRNAGSLGQLAYGGSWESVLTVSLTCLKCMRRQEDWPHCDEQVRTGNGEPRQKAQPNS